jgi:ATP-dependent Clp protease, protease subunit
MKNFAEITDFEEEETKDSEDWEKFFVKNYRENIKNRILILNQDINSNLIEKFTMPLIALDKINQKPITLYINSDGGELYESFNMVDVIESIKSPVNTVCLGRALSGGFVIFVAGEKRFVYKNSILMMHPIRAWTEGDSVPSLLKNAEFLSKETKRMAKYFASRTNKSEKYWEEKVLQAAHDTFYFADEALKFGIATEIIEKQRGK